MGQIVHRSQKEKQSAKGNSKENNLIRKKILQTSLSSDFRNVQFMNQKRNKQTK